MSSKAVFLRHQAGAVISTAVDFLVMVAWVELVGGSPILATAVGAASGAFTNFLLGRRWIFQAESRPAVGQALRYALVSAGSLVLNSLGQVILLRGLGLSSYVLTRVGVAVVVALSWNFPLHRFFVFAGGRREVAPPRRREAA